MGFGFLMGWRNKKPYKIFPLIYGKENIVGSKQKGNLGWVMGYGKAKNRLSLKIDCIHGLDLSWGKFDCIKVFLKTRV